ncbi:MAG: hypothetical protein IJP62_00280 [Treponema sp.]|nr:hypothetical protein [Treponema sp.]
MIFNALVYYVFSASVFLMYGISLNNLVSSNSNYGSLMLTGVKSLITSTMTIALSYVIANLLLAPAHLAELFPFVTVFVFIMFSAIIEVFIGIGLQNSITEFGMPLLCVLIAINESSSIGYAIVIAIACITAFYVLFGIVYALRNRFDMFSPAMGLRVYCLLFVSLAIILIALRAFNVSWFTNLGGM